MASWRQSYFNYSQTSLRGSTYNDVPYALINFLCALVDFLRTPINPPSSLVDALLYRRLSNALDRSLSEVRDTYLIVCDGIS